MNYLSWQAAHWLHTKPFHSKFLGVRYDQKLGSQASQRVDVQTLRGLSIVNNGFSNFGGVLHVAYKSMASRIFYSPGTESKTFIVSYSVIFSAKSGRFFYALVKLDGSCPWRSFD